jgi:hypothetical protein
VFACILEDRDTEEKNLMELALSYHRKFIEEKRKNVDDLGNKLLSSGVPCQSCSALGIALFTAVCGGSSYIMTYVYDRANITEIIPIHLNSVSTNVLSGLAGAAIMKAQEPACQKIEIKPIECDIGFKRSVSEIVCSTILKPRRREIENNTYLDDIDSNCCSEGIRKHDNTPAKCKEALDRSTVQVNDLKYFVEKLSKGVRSHHALLSVGCTTSEIDTRVFLYCNDKPYLMTVFTNSDCKWWLGVNSMVQTNIQKNSKDTDVDHREVAQKAQDIKLQDEAEKNALLAETNAFYIKILVAAGAIMTCTVGPNLLKAALLSQTVTCFARLKSSSIPAAINTLKSEESGMVNTALKWFGNLRTTLWRGVVTPPQYALYGINGACMTHLPIPLVIKKDENYYKFEYAGNQQISPTDPFYVYIGEHTASQRICTPSPEEINEMELIYVLYGILPIGDKNSCWTWKSVKARNGFGNVDLKLEFSFGRSTIHLTASSTTAAAPTSNYEDRSRRPISKARRSRSSSRG